MKKLRAINGYDRFIVIGLFLFFILIAISVCALNSPVPKKSDQLDVVISGNMLSSMAPGRDPFWDIFSLNQQKERLVLDSNCVIYDHNMGKSNLQEITAGKNILVFKSSIEFYSSEIKSIKSAISTLIKDSLIILLDSDNNRSLKLKAAMNQGDFRNVFYINKGFLNITRNGIPSSFFFKIGPSFEMENIHEIDNYDIDRKYVEHMLALISEQNKKIAQ